MQRETAGQEKSARGEERSIIDCYYYQTIKTQGNHLKYEDRWRQTICCMDYIYTYTAQNARINKENKYSDNNKYS